MLALVLLMVVEIEILPGVSAHPSNSSSRQTVVWVPEDSALLLTVLDQTTATIRR